MKHVLDLLYDNAFALEESCFRRMVDFVERRAQGGGKLSSDDIEEAVAEGQAAAGGTRRRQRRPYTVHGSVAVVPVHGVISKRASLVDDMSPGTGTSTEAIGQLVRQALDDDAVDAIMLDVDSPGGSVSGVDELAAELFEARDRKPVYAMIDGTGASAAYWLASQAERIFATSGSRVGSIGVVASLRDSSRRAENEGLRVDLIRSVPGKATGAAGAPVTDSDRAAVRDEVQAFHELFEAAVGRGRGISDEEAAALADGRVHVGRRAVEAGLVDEILPFSRALEQVQAAARGDDGADRDERPAARASETEPVAAAAEGETMTKPTKAAADALDAASGQEPENTKPVAPQAADSDPEQIAASARQEERKRIQQIRELAASDQSKLADELIENGTAVGQAAITLAQDGKRRREALLASSRADQQPLEPGDGDTPTASGDPIEVEAQAVYDKLSAGERELLSFDEFLADFRREKEGRR